MPQQSTSDRAPALSSFLESHRLRYGIAGYRDASTLTLDSDGAVAVCAVVRSNGGLAMYAWEARQDRHSAPLNDATFAVAYDAPTSFGLIDADRLRTADYEAFPGEPAAAYRLDRTAHRQPSKEQGEQDSWNKHVPARSSSARGRRV